MAGPAGDASSAGKVARPTHADVARLARVSTATVSYVLNKADGRRISEGTREAVHRAAEQLGYRPNVAARNLASGKSGVVLYVVPRVAVGEMPMLAGSRMTTDWRAGACSGADLRGRGRPPRRRRGQRSRSGRGHQPVSVEPWRSLRAVERRHMSPTSKSERCLHSGDLRICQLVRSASSTSSPAGTGRSPSPIPGSPNGVPLATIGSKVSPERLRGPRPPGTVTIGDVTMENAVDVVTGWVRDGIDAVCAQSDEIACLGPVRHPRGGPVVPGRPGRDRRRRQPHGGH